MLLVGCHQEQPEKRPVLADEPMIFKVDETGAFIDTETFQVVLEPGALGGEGHLSLLCSEDETMENAASPRYCIEGPVLHLQNPMKIRIKPEKRLKEDTYLMISEDVFVPQLNQNSKQYYLVEGHASGDFIEAKLPIEKISDDRLATLNPFTAYTNAQQLHIEVVLLTHQKTETIENINFVSERTVSTEMQDAFMKNYNELQAYFKNHLAMEDKEEGQEVLVEFRKTQTISGNEDRVLFIPTMWGDAYVHYVVYLKDEKLPPSFKAQLAKAIMVHYQHLYDYRSAYRKAVGPPEYHWFDIACMAWVEGEFLDNAPMTPKFYHAYEQEILKGLMPDTPQLNVHRVHGIGMASLVKYIQLNYDEKSISAIYNSLQNGSDLSSAFQFAIGDYDTWLLDFYKTYAMGRLYQDGYDANALWRRYGLLNALKIPGAEGVGEASKRQLLLNHLYMEPFRPYFMAVELENWNAEALEYREKIEIYTDPSEVEMKIVLIDEKTGELEELTSSDEHVLRLRHLEQWKGKRALLILAYVPGDEQQMGRGIKLYGDLGRWPQRETILGEWKNGTATMDAVYIDPILANAVRTGNETVETYGCDPNSLALFESLLGEERMMILQFEDQDGLELRMNLHSEEDEPGTLSEPIAVTYNEGVLSGDHEFEYNDYKIQMVINAEVIQFEDRLEMTGVLSYTFVDEAVATSTISFYMNKERVDE